MHKMAILYSSAKIQRLKMVVVELMTSYGVMTDSGSSWKFILLLSGTHSVNDVITRAPSEMVYGRKPRESDTSGLS